MTVYVPLDDAVAKLTACDRAAVTDTSTPPAPVPLAPLLTVPVMLPARASAAVTVVVLPLFTVTLVGTAEPSAGLSRKHCDTYWVP